jgi:type II secretion system protein D
MFRAPSALKFTLFLLGVVAFQLPLSNSVESAQSTLRATTDSQQVYTLRHRSTEDLESYLVEMLPSTKYNFKLYRNTRNEFEISVSTDAATHKLIKDLIANFDLPPNSNEANTKSESPLVRSYTTSTENLKTTADDLRNRFGKSGDFSIRIDQEKNRLIILAAQQVHDQISQSLTPSPNPQSASLPIESESQTNSTPAKTKQLTTDWQTIVLPGNQAEEMKQTLQSLLSSKAVSTQVDQGLLLTLYEGTPKSFQVGWQTSDPKIYYKGTAAACRELANLVESLKSSAARSNASLENRFQYLSIAHSPFNLAEQLINAYGVGKTSPQIGSRNGIPSSPASFAKPLAQETAPPPTTTPSQEPALPPSTQVPAQEPLPGDQGDEETQKKQEELLRQLRDSVQVETLPDLGIIILRGRQKEVEELSRIIRELERLGADTTPEIRIVELKHTRGDAIQRIIQTVSNDLVNTRQGRVTVTPLFKPNALLLVGWGDAVGVVTDLIEKLDQPVAVDSQFEVFRLVNAQVAQIQANITTFFTAREGLGPKVQVVSDLRTNSLIVYASPRDMEEVRRLITELDVDNYRKIQQARIVKVRNALASELATTLQNAIKAAQGTGPQQAAVLELLAIDSAGEKVLRSGVLDQVQVTPNPLNNTLIISGPAESMDLLDALIKQLDVVGSSAQIKVFRVENGDAASLVQMLRSLLPGETSASLKLSSDADEPSLAPLRFSIDARTNSIIATGSEGDLRIIEALLLRLDEREFSQRKNTVYRLKNAPAVDVALAINNFLRSERQAQEISPGTLSPFEQIEREVVVVPEPVGNRLIVSATPRYYEEIERLIEQLDEPPPQVVIQVLIAEVSLENVDEFGVELGLQDSILFDRSLLDNLITTTRTTNFSTPSGIVTTTEQVIQSATNEPGFNFNNTPLGNSGSQKSLATSNSVGGQGLSNFAVGRMNGELGFGGLVLSASSESISMLLRALEECKRLEVLSRPQVRTLDNQPAFIQVGQRVPRIVGSTVNQNGQSNAITLENVGLILGVTPRISPDGAVVMEVDAERSALGPESDGIPVSIAPDGSVIRSPRIDTTTAQATVSASSGETIILGGLITKKTLTIDRRVPLLSKIPLLGNFFRYDLNQQERAELLIILTPYVIRGPEDEYRLKQAEYSRMSWCICDAEAIHGDIGATVGPIPALVDGPDTQVIYPEGAAPTTDSNGQENSLPSENDDSGFEQPMPRERDTPQTPPPPKAQRELPPSIVTPATRDQSSLGPRDQLNQPDRSR